MPTDDKPAWSRRAFLGAVTLGGVAGGAGLVWAAKRRLRNQLAKLLPRKDFAATPALLPHDPVKERRTLHVSRGLGPAGNIDAVVAGLGGMQTVVGKDDVVLVKVSAQWWNQGMTNVAAVKRVIELILATPGFAGEVIVFENTHFLADGSPLTRGFTYPSAWNVDVPGWTGLADLFPHFKQLGAPVSYVGLVDAMRSSNGNWDWRDPGRKHGVYGGDGRGPIAEGELRDGYRWDFGKTFRVPRSLVDDAQTPLTWPVFTSPHSGITVDLRDGLSRRQNGKLVPVSDRKLTWITMPTVNEHASTGLTCCCKSAMGIVDMSAGHPGNHPSTRDYASVHYFGNPHAFWRMAGPLAQFAREVRAPDMYIAVAEWVGATPKGAWDPEADLRIEKASAHHVNAVVAGTDPVAVDAWCARNLLTPLRAGDPALYDLDDPDSTLSRFLRYYRAVYGSGTLDASLVQVA